MPRNSVVTVVVSWLLASAAHAQSVLVEAESFTQPGGWSLDTQFIREMGSPYLLAHGLGQPVADAGTTVKFPATGKYHVFVRTKDWVARWNAKGQPGRFNLLVAGKPLAKTFGAEGANWFWQDGGAVNIETAETTIALHDLTGFDGRCDAIYFTKDDQAPPAGKEILPGWRRKLLGLADKPTEKSGYDLVVVGGGYSGMGAAISAARMGCKVALIQDRPVLGGNGSSEIRVWAMGLIKRGKYPHVGEIVEEFADRAPKSPGTAESFGDEKKLKSMLAEANVELFLNHHAYNCDTKEKKITAVYAFDTRTSEEKKFTARNFVDCTGHGTLGALAGAAWDMKADGRMGMSNMWTWSDAEKEAKFPETPWALDLVMKDFPYPKDGRAEWFWEGGFNKDPLNDAEGIRDWNLRAAYGAFNAMKNRDGAEKHKNAQLTWIAYIGGPRESRRLLGDVLLTQDDVVTKKDFPDGCVPSTWSIDLHVPKKQFSEKFPEDPFISMAIFDNRIDRDFGYPIPYRCFYSKNVDNLFMAGRCISVTHEALGTVRVMKTCGMMGEVVGKAAAICAIRNCSPREVYEKYWSELDELLKLSGKASRATLDDKLNIPVVVETKPVKPAGPPAGLDPAKLPGLIIDDAQAKLTGKWSSNGNLSGYVGQGYHYAAADSGASARYEFKAPAAGPHEIRSSYLAHENRAKAAPVIVETSAGKKSFTVNQREAPKLENGFHALGVFDLKANENVSVTISTAGAGGIVHVDAVQVVPAK